MDLVSSIIDYMQTRSPDLFALCNEWIADFDPDCGKTMPYATVQENGFAVERPLNLGRTRRADEITILISVYALTRSEVVAILNAIDDALQVATIEGVFLPRIENKLTFWDLNCWQGVITLSYIIEKRYE